MRILNPSSIYRVSAIVTILLLAAIIRLNNLSFLPLNDSEAANAIQASELLRQVENKTVDQPQPIYTLLTGVLFAVTDDTNFFARLIPALAGIIIVLLPLLHLKEMGHWQGLLLAFFLAIDPLSAALSRTASGDILAQLFTLLLGNAVMRRNAIWSGILAALLLLSGPFAWFSLTILLISGVILYFFPGTTSSELIKPLFERSREIIARREGWLAFLVTLVALGTGFMMLSGTWQSAAGGMIAFFDGFLFQPGVPLGTWLLYLLPFIALPVTLLVILVLFNFTRPTPFLRIASVMAAVITALLIMYAGRQIPYAVWFTLPVYLAAAMNLPQDLYQENENRLSYLIGSLIVFCLLVFIYLDASALLKLATPMNTVHLVALVGGLVLIAVVIVLVLWGWSVRLGETIAAVSLLCVMLLWSISMSFSLAGTRQNAVPEVAYGNVIRDQFLLDQTLRQLSNSSARSETEMRMLVIGKIRPSLQWYLRDFVNVVNADTPAPNISTPVVITDMATNVNISNNYRGQDFLWSSTPATPTRLLDWARWFIKTELTTNTDGYLLWANVSLFPQ